MSFRVWALDGGHGPYDEDSLAFSDAIFKALLDEFGSDGYKKCNGEPVNEYGAYGPMKTPTPSPVPTVVATPLPLPD